MISQTSESVLAQGGIEIGDHPGTFELFGLTFNGNTIWATVLGALIILGLGFWLRARVTSGVPSGLQLFFEGVTAYTREQVENNIGLRVAPFVVPFAISLFLFILVTNSFSVLPVQIGGKDWVPPPASDINFVVALAWVTLIWTHVAGSRRRGTGTHFLQTAKGHMPAFFLINIIEELAKFLSLPLRLFGNIFGGVIMVTLITSLIPAYIMWAPNAIWKTFDLFVGLIQAFIFALLTILYFSQTMETHEEQH